MLTKIISEFTVHDTLVQYHLDETTGAVGLLLLPAAMKDRLATFREKTWNEPARKVDPIVHLKIVGDPYSGGFAQGRTMRASPSNARFRFEGQAVERTAHQSMTVLTTLADAGGCRIEHRLSWFDGDAAMDVLTSFHNGSNRRVTLEMLTSFSLGGITPFDVADAPGKLRAHRIRSVWAAEGRLDSQSIEQLHLERSCTAAGLFSERFGTLGTMPVRGWFPFVAIEDTAAGVTWGANLAWAGSWQMEIGRQFDDVSISGGLADREFGQWTKTLAAGETIVMPPAVIACAAGGVDELCDRLTAKQNRAADTHPAIEQDLPIAFNEWCTTWGRPTHDRLLQIADRLAGTEVKYLVIDAGWYTNATGGGGHGDWLINREFFPNGLAATTAAIRERGLIPGLWFEMETVDENSTAFSRVDHLLKRDGLPITVRGRRFWDLNDPVAIDHLANRVIGTLRDCNLGYLKVDYNETLGLGCDGAESQGEGLRRQVEGIHALFDRIRRELPELVIENCASGGHRLEPSMLACTAMSSFSDAHELPEIPIIAAALHRVMLPRQSQVWAVLREKDSDRRITYSLAALFLGRVGLSGDIDKLSPAQWQQFQVAMKLYRQIVPILRDGVTRLANPPATSWRTPTGWQGVVRTASDGKSAMVVLHSFADAPSRIEFPLPPGDWTIANAFGEQGANRPIIAKGSTLVWNVPGDFAGAVVQVARR